MAAPYETLDAVLAPARPLGEVEGITVVLVSVELWSSGVFVQLAGLRSALTDALDAEFEARQAIASPHPPWQAGDRLMELPLTLADDVGTEYRSLVRSAGGTATEWRSQWRFEPGVPKAATRLTVALGGLQPLALPLDR